MAVYKDNNGSWYISVRYVNWKGEHARKVKRGFATKREATEWERSFLQENAGNLDMSFETFVDLYKKNLKERLKLGVSLFLYVFQRLLAIKSNQNRVMESGFTSAVQTTNQCNFRQRL